MGRNELVADQMNEWLALRHPDENHPDEVIPVEEQAVTRKMVSSHLQVLKQKFAGFHWGKHNDYVLGAC